jgi:hypothetical protein
MESGGFWLAGGRTTTFTCTTLDASASCSALLFEAGRSPVDFEVTRSGTRVPLSLAPLARVTVPVSSAHAESIAVRATGTDRRALFISVPEP